MIEEHKEFYSFLKGDFGKEIVDEYNSVVKSKYRDNFELKVLTFQDNVVKGSSDYAIFLMNDIIAKYGLRTVNPANTQKIIDINEDFLKGFYVDLGIVLRNENETNEYLARQNEYLARQLANQAKDRNYKFSNSNPLVFKPSDLELTLDNNSFSGLGFKIKDSAIPFNAPELSYENNSKKFNKTNENGVPIFDINGNRPNNTMDIIENGLSRFSLYTDLGLDSWNDDFYGSREIGRIVLVNDTLSGAPKI